MDEYNNPKKGYERFLMNKGAIPMLIFYVFHPSGNFVDIRILLLSHLKLGGYLVICIFEGSRHQISTS